MKPVKTKIILVYCEHCQHLFYDKFDRESINQSKEYGFICPYCLSKLEMV